MPNRPAWFGLGWLIALVVLIVTTILWLGDEPLTRDRLLALVAALALARLVP